VAKGWRPNFWRVWKKPLREAQAFSVVFAGVPGAAKGWRRRLWWVIQKPLMVLAEVVAVVEDMMINFLILLIPTPPYLWSFPHQDQMTLFWESPGSNDNPFQAFLKSFKKESFLKFLF
jgi:hypothetical protein